ncbi:hypothetical protein ACW5W6_17050, partial [Aeromonas mytilicola]
MRCVPVLLAVGGGGGGRPPPAAPPPPPPPPLAGVRQLLLPDFSMLTGQSVLDALGLAFFSL